MSNVIDLDEHRTHGRLRADVLALQIPNVAALAAMPGFLDAVEAIRESNPATTLGQAVEIVTKDYKAAFAAMGLAFPQESETA